MTRVGRVHIAGRVSRECDALMLLIKAAKLPQRGTRSVITRTACQAFHCILMFRAVWFERPRPCAPDICGDRRDLCWAHRCLGAPAWMGLLRYSGRLVHVDVWIDAFLWLMMDCLWLSTSLGKVFSVGTHVKCVVVYISALAAL